jgi:hypothetical protein
MCILEWLTILQEEPFLFIAPKSHFPSAKNGVLYGATTKWKFQSGTTPFKKKY